MPTTFDGTPIRATAGDTISLHVRDTDQPTQRVILLVGDERGHELEVVVHLDGEGQGSTSWSVPRNWSGRVLLRTEQASHRMTLAAYPDPV